MLRTLPLRATRLTPTARAFSMSAIRAAAGDTGSGSSRSGGVAQGDAFSKREKANEDMYVRDQEMIRIKKLREDLRKKNLDLKELEKEVEKAEKDLK